jgi:hypothetical protein
MINSEPINYSVRFTKFCKGGVFFKTQACDISTAYNFFVGVNILSNTFVVA